MESFVREILEFIIIETKIGPEGLINAMGQRATTPEDGVQTRHKVLNRDARSLSVIPDNCAQLIVTSPPYPMIEMWDHVFTSMSPAVQNSLDSGLDLLSFEKMHHELDKVWKE